MDRAPGDAETIEQVLRNYAAIPFSYVDVVSQPVFDRERGQFLIMLAGWDGDKRVHGCLVHLALRDGKIWVERDGIEAGIATYLLEAGIPAERIVLAFLPPDDRVEEGFAVA
jgi:hypothetical protein